MFDRLVNAALTNAVLVVLLAFVVSVLTLVWRHPRWGHGLWLLVLVKFLVPPMIAVPLPAIAGFWSATDDSPTGNQEISSPLPLHVPEIEDDAPQIEPPVMTNPIAAAEHF